MKKNETPKGETTNKNYYQLYPSVVQEGFKRTREVYVITAVLSNLNYHNKEMVLFNEQGIDYHFRCSQSTMYNFLGMTRKTFERGIKDLETNGYFTHISKHKPKSIFQTSYFLMTEKGLSLFNGTRQETKTIEIEAEEEITQPLIDNVQTLLLPISEEYYNSMKDFYSSYISCEEIIMNPFIDDISTEEIIFQPKPTEIINNNPTTENISTDENNLPSIVKERNPIVDDISIKLINYFKDLSFRSPFSKSELSNYNDDLKNIFEYSKSDINKAWQQCKDDKWINTKEIRINCEPFHEILNLELYQKLKFEHLENDYQWLMNEYKPNE
ncbi:MAG: hypothetical protein LBI15_00120 [Dysgonamonadaceae bacterium]|jgi:hypothetical protein|nr:hypothetical protein [Dysgonamonadaceae bacterium]